MTEIELANMGEEVARISQLRVDVLTALDTEWVIGVASNAEKLRTWLKVTDAADEARRAAVELECIALRQVAILWGDSHGRPDGWTAAKWNTARGFASVDDVAFGRLLNKLRAASAPSFIYRSIREEFEAEERERRRSEGYSTFINGVANASDDDDERHVYRVQRAAETLVEALGLDGAAFTVSDAALDLGDILAAGELAGVADWHDGSIQASLRAVVRKAIQDAPDDLGSGVPSIITYVDGDMGPIRIPSRNANLSHLLAMAAYRRKQATEAVAVADALEGTATALVELLEGDESYEVKLSALVGREPGGEAIAA